MIRTLVIPNHNDYKYAALFKSSTSRNAIFGDSHAAYGLTGIAGFVNMAYGGNNFESIRNKVSLYFENRRPGKVILQAGLHHFSRDFLYGRDEENNPEDFARFLDGYSKLYPQTFVKPHRSAVFRYWNVLMHGGGFVPVQHFEPDGSRLGDADYSQVPLKTRLAAAARTALVFEPIAEFEDSTTARKYKETIAFLQDKGAEVCLVTFPVFSLLRDKIREFSRYSRVEQFFTDLAREKGIRYRNFLFADLPDNFFSDPHHLNAEGARRFSGMVNEACFG